MSTTITCFPLPSFSPSGVGWAPVLKFQFQEPENPTIAPGMLTDKDNLLRRLHALRSEHRDLDTVIARITEHSPLDQLQIQRLKKRKLGLKDEIAWLESRLIPDRTA